MSDRLLASSLVWLRACSVLGLGLALAGCAAGGGWAAGAMMLLSLGALALSGCSASHGTREDAGVAVDAPPSTDAGGYWEACCVDGRVDTCFCPSGWACNYGWFNDCGDGTCVDPVSECPGQIDAGMPDAGGTWDPCCVDGTITTCFCPGGAECNYGLFTDCGDGTCVDPSLTCPEQADAGTPDAGGTWDPCCIDGAITTCWCPPDAICNYWYEDCGGGLCVLPGDACPATPAP